MAVAIGASCAFLTPIGHQNNTLILGPGGSSLRRLPAARRAAGSPGAGGQRADAAAGVAAVGGFAAGARVAISLARPETPG